MAHLTFHVSKLKLLLCDDQRPNQKHKVQLEVDAIEHKLVEIESIFWARQTCPRGKKIFGEIQGLPSSRNNMDEAYSLGPFAINGKQVWTWIGL